MKTSKYLLKSTGAFAALTLAASTLLAGEVPARITVDLGKPGVKVSPTLFGIFFEEINRAGDGGIYAEMIQNRSFEDAPDVPLAWTLVKSAGAGGAMSLDRSHPLNTENPTSLKLEIMSTGGGRVGAANVGFKGCPEVPVNNRKMWAEKFDKATQEYPNGIPARAGKQYRCSLYARAAAGFDGPLTVSLEKQDGTALAEEKITGLGANWKKFETVLVPKSEDSNARLVVSASNRGTVWLDMVSLFPADTFKNHLNGLRADLAQMIADMHPAFMRFPGGCFVEGERLEERAQWKKTIGDIAERPGHWNLWGYRSTDGLGMFEYLQFCEDIGAEPLFVINVGMSHQQQENKKPAPSPEEMKQYVQDALDAIEYANGPADSQWGSLRAKAGHPEPFHLKFMEIGNENGGPIYDAHYALFYDAIKKLHPDMRLVANFWAGGRPKSRPVEILDEHYYSTPEFFMLNAGRYNKYDRNGPKIYVGEYAVTNGCGRGNLRAALGEAAFMTGLERNGDIVEMASYAPLLEHVDWKKWNPNAILFDSAKAYGTPSYHVQQMFSSNRSEEALPVTLDASPALLMSGSGRIGVGTYQTQAEYKDIKITAPDGKMLFESDFSKGTGGWKMPQGKWKVVDGALRQTGSDNRAIAVIGDPKWKDFTLSLKARKLGGKEGFFVSFQLKNDGDKSRWNIGGWNNTALGLEYPGTTDKSRVPGHIENNRWYDIRIEIKGASVKCYLDGKLIHDVTRHAPNALFATAGWKGDGLILKVVNAAPEPQAVDIRLDGGKQIAPVGSALVLTSANPADENSFAEPAKIAPKEEQVSGLAATFNRIFPANSITILKIQSAR